MKRKIIYLTTGKESYHIESLYSLASAIKLLGDKREEIEFVVHTDQASFYRALPVSVRHISQKTLLEWKGPIDYIFRAKHACLLSELENSEQCILIDSDTFFHRTPMSLFERVSKESLLCNELQHKFGENKDDYTYKSLAHHLQKLGLAPDNMYRLNSGVIGLTKENKVVLEKSIALMDKYHSKASASYNLEEFALAVTSHAKNLSVNTCTDIIKHYWSRKNLVRAKIVAWYQKHGESPLSEAAFNDMLLINTRPPKPPAPKRLFNKAKSLLIPRQQRQLALELMNGCYHYQNEFERACKFAWWETALKNASEKNQLNRKQVLTILKTPAFRLSIGVQHSKEISDYLDSSTDF
ncbi:hypothetical protein [Pseudomonas oryzihabitans]|uniref:hypothetical protein n=1 Tax=Pseudomonas oryzihabitans TaxID=47885 RepID=UPI000AF18022|nr:hypothetical protein [Pseudomonas oryzihabitans]